VEAPPPILFFISIVFLLLFLIFFLFCFFSFSNLKKKSFHSRCHISRNFHIWCSDVSSLEIAAETMAEYDASQFHPRSLKCVLSLNSKQAHAVCALYSLLGKTKIEQHLAIVDHFFETPNLKSEKNQKAQSDNNDKFNTLLERAQKNIEAQIAQSQQIFEQVTNNFLERITATQQLAPTASHDNEVTK
jgi:regulator of PEP synthase PpsR (kinase-PPPase family)